MTQPLRALVDYARRGPHPVGVTQLDLPGAGGQNRRLPTEVWYPAEVRDFERHPEAEHPLGAPHAARQDAPGQQGEPAPLLGFSHGNSGFRQQSTFLTTHLASWGFVVVAPDHTGNTFFEMVQVTDEDERIRIHKDARRNRPEDLSTCLDAAVSGTGPWPGIDPERIGVLGHSYGGWTALKMPRRDTRIAAVCGLAPVSEPFVGKKAFLAGELPLPCPSLIVPALDDVLVDIETSIRPLRARLEDAALVGIRDADHFHFCDHLELIHGLHQKNSPRPKQTRPTRPYADLLPEPRAQRLVSGLVTGFFAAALGPDPAATARLLAADSLAGLDTALARLDSDPGASR